MICIEACKAIMSEKFLHFVLVISFFKDITKVFTLSAFVMMVVLVSSFFF